MKKKFNYKIIISIFLISLLLISFAFKFIWVYRFTPIQAVKSSSFIRGDIKVFGEVNRDWANVYLLETQDGIKTALTVKKGLLWDCPLIICFFDDIIKNDEVKTVGWVGYEENNKQINVFAVQTKDPNVKFIEVGTNSDRQRKTIGLNETVIFTWDKAISTDVNPIAFDKNNLQLYKYEYNPKHLNVTDTKELRWYSINNR